MPKGRYAAMKSSLGNKGRLALDMMLMTATVQANLDWSDEADLASKVRAATAVSPVVTAMFANSPLIDGRDCGYLDFRYQVWRETDAARCGLLEQMLRPGWGYRPGFYENRHFDRRFEHREFVERRPYWRR